MCKVNAILLQTHHNQLTATPSAKHTLTVLKDILPKKAMVMLLFMHWPLISRPASKNIQTFSNFKINV